MCGPVLWLWLAWRTVLTQVIISADFTEEKLVTVKKNILNGQQSFLSSDQCYEIKTPIDFPNSVLCKFIPFLGTWWKFEKIQTKRRQIEID